MYEEPLSPNEGACCGKAEWPHESARFTYMLSRNRQMRGVFSMFDEPESPNEGGTSKIKDE